MKKMSLLFVLIVLIMGLAAPRSVFADSPTLLGDMSLWEY
jgi:hypothetical protein